MSPNIHETKEKTFDAQWAASIADDLEGCLCHDDTSRVGTRNAEFAVEQLRLAVQENEKLRQQRVRCEELIESACARADALQQKLDYIERHLDAVEGDLSITKTDGDPLMKLGVARAVLAEVERIVEESK